MSTAFAVPLSPSSARRGLFSTRPPLPRPLRLPTPPPLSPPVRRRGGRLRMTSSSGEGGPVGTPAAAAAAATAAAAAAAAAAADAATIGGDATVVAPARAAARPPPLPPPPTTASQSRSNSRDARLATPHTLNDGRPAGADDPTDWRPATVGVRGGYRRADFAVSAGALPPTPQPPVTSAAATPATTTTTATTTATSATAGAADAAAAAPATDAAAGGAWGGHLHPVGGSGCGWRLPPGVVLPGPPVMRASTVAFRQRRDVAASAYAAWTPPPPPPSLSAEVASPPQRRAGGGSGGGGRAASRRDGILDGLFYGRYGTLTARVAETAAAAAVGAAFATSAPSLLAGVHAALLPACRAGGGVWVGGGVPPAVAAVVGVGVGGGGGLYARLGVVAAPLPDSWAVPADCGWGEGEGKPLPPHGTAEDPPKMVTARGQLAQPLAVLLAPPSPDAIPLDLASTAARLATAFPRVSIAILDATGTLTAPAAPGDGRPSGGLAPLFVAGVTTVVAPAADGGGGALLFTGTPTGHARVRGGVKTAATPSAGALSPGGAYAAWRGGRSRGVVAAAAATSAGALVAALSSWVDPVTRRGLGGAAATPSMGGAAAAGAAAAVALPGQPQRLSAPPPLRVGVWYPGTGPVVGVTLSGGAATAADAFVDGLTLVALAEADAAGVATTVWPDAADEVVAAVAAGETAAARAAVWGAGRVRHGAAGPPPPPPPPPRPVCCRRLTFRVGLEDPADLCRDVLAALDMAAAVGSPAAGGEGTPAGGRGE